MNPEQPDQYKQPDSYPPQGYTSASPSQPTYAPPQSAQTPMPQTQSAGNAAGSPLPYSNSAHSGSDNPYSFIFNEKHEAQSSPRNGSLMRRVLIIVGGLVILGIVAAVVISLLVPKDSSFQLLTEIVQEQQEVVRVADLTSQSAATTDTKNLAINVSLSVGSDEASIQKYLVARNVKLTSDILAAKKDTKTDTLFENAKAANTFDHTAAQTLQTQLVTYRSNLNSTYQKVKGTNARAELKRSYQNAETLITEANRVVDQ